MAEILNKKAQDEDIALFMERCESEDLFRPNKSIETHVFCWICVLYVAAIFGAAGFWYIILHL